MLYAELLFTIFFGIVFVPVILNYFVELIVGFLME